MVLPKFVGKRAKSLGAPKLCRPASSGIENRIVATGCGGSFLSFPFMNRIERYWKAEILAVSRYGDPQGSFNQLEPFANNMDLFGDSNCPGKQETAGRLTQSFARKAKNAPRAG